MDRSFVDHNDASRERLAALVGALGEDDLTRPLDRDWTVSATLAHVAFWDRFVLARWEAALAADGTVEPVSDDLQDKLNAPALPDWRALPPFDAARLAIAAAEAVDRTIARLPEEAVRGAEARGQHRLLDRSVHRREHVDEIAAALAGDA